MVYGHLSIGRNRQTLWRKSGNHSTLLKTVVTLPLNRKNHDPRDPMPIEAKRQTIHWETGKRINRVKTEDAVPT